MKHQYTIPANTFHQAKITFIQQSLPFSCQSKNVKGHSVLKSLTNIVSQTCCQSFFNDMGQTNQNNMFWLQRDVYTRHSPVTLQLLSSQNINNYSHTNNPQNVILVSPSVQKVSISHHMWPASHLCHLSGHLECPKARLTSKINPFWGILSRLHFSWTAYV